MPRPERFACLCFTALAVAGAASAAEFRLFESILSHDAATEAAAYGAVSAQAPADWSTPVDYAGGTVHFRLEVLEKPTATGVMAQVCLEQGGRAAGKRACAKDFAFFDKGDYRWSQPLADFTGAAVLDWTSKPEELVLLHKDCFGKSVSSKTGDWVGSPYLTLYYPLRARLTAAVVSKDGTFSGWPASIRRPRPAAASPLFPPFAEYRADGRSLLPGPGPAAPADRNRSATGITFTRAPAPAR